MVGQSRDNALDHVVVVVFENRSLDNVLGRLYGPEDGKTFEGVTGKDLTNPIPEWAEHGADRKVVPYTVATDMDSPNPDTGEEYPHTNTQLFGILSEANRFKLGEEITAPYNAPEPGQAPTMDGFVTDYVSTLTAELGRQPTYEEYSQVMTGFTPEQIPVLSGLARGFGVFDHWFCEVPSQTFTNRSFWTAATASGMVVNQPVKNWLAGNTAETIFKFDRSGYRVPAILVSPWVAEGEVFNQEHRHTSLIATLREQWDLGDPLTGRDAAAQTFSHAFTLNPPATRPPGQPQTHARYPNTSRTPSASDRSCPPSAKPVTTASGPTPSSTTSRSRDYLTTPTPRSPQTRPCTSSTTSWPSSSPCCIRPPRDPEPRPDPDVRQL